MAFVSFPYEKWLKHINILDGLVVDTGSKFWKKRWFIDSSSPYSMVEPIGYPASKYGKEDTDRITSTNIQVLQRPRSRASLNFLSNTQDGECCK